MNPILRVIGYVRRYPGLASAQLVCAVLATVMVVVFPKVTEIIIDDVIPNEKRDLLPIMITVALGAFFLRELFDSFRIQINNTFEQKVIYDLRSDLYEHIQRLPLGWFDNRPTGDTMTCVSEDVTNMERVLIDGIEQGVVAVLQLLVVGGMMFLTNATLAACALAPIPLLIIGAIIYTRGRRRYTLLRQATGEMNSLLHDNIAGIRQIKAYALEESEHAHFNEASQKVRHAALRVMRAWAIYKPGMAFLNSLGSVIVIGVGAHLVFRDELTRGQLVNFLLLITLYFYDPITRLHQLNQLFLTGRAAADRVFGVLDSEPEKNLDAGSPLPGTKGHVRYENVSFSYTGHAATLSDINIEARPGQAVALVGPTGAGKSTIIDLLARFYQHDAGSITIDGTDITTLDKRSLRDHIGYVTQETFLFNGTIRDNLTIAKGDATDDELWKALSIANAHHFIDRLPKKLGTEVGERGIKLSVGEKQRISIARALLKNPPILLLDEATASVDTETERLIQEALQHLMEDRTSFVIAHRLSTVRNADRIYVLDHGRIVEEGTHEELLAQGGHYAKLSRTSFLDE